MSWHVVIAGGGFGGFYAARTLVRRLPPHGTRITLVSDVNYMLYTPLLPGAAAGTLEPRHVVVPLREELPGSIELRLGRITRGRPQDRVLEIRSLTGTAAEIGYDHLIVALGSVSRTLPVPGLAEHAMGFKSLADAIALRNRVVQCMETAETLEDPEERSAHLSFVFVGAGYAGLEGLAELQDFAADIIDLYPRCRVTGMRWVLVEATERIMPEIDPALATFAARELRARGIEILTGTTLEEAGPGVARLSGGRVLRTHTIAWTAGVKPHPVLTRMGLPLDDRGRIVVDDRLRVQGHFNVWAVGDSARVPDPATKGRTACPPTAQHAIRQARVAARNVAAEIGSGSRRRFRYKTRGVFVDMGRRKAVARTMGIQWSGTAAWLLARTYHLAMMPGIGRRARLLVDWNIGLLFGRDTAELGQLGHPPALDAVQPGTEPQALPAGSAF